MKRRDVIKGLAILPLATQIKTQPAHDIGIPEKADKSFIDLSRINPGSYDGTWWNRTPLRMIQTNMNETDAKQDTDIFVNHIVEAAANMCLISVGGIVANYPTKLPFHYKNPNLRGDYVGTLLTKLHANSIRVIGRFDFSKVNENIAAQKPDWLYIGNKGTVNQNGQVSACLNGGYQQEYAFEILKEVVSTYPLDGIFFNMPGYNTTDYVGNNYGICQCENCKKRFFAETGLKLPLTNNDPSIIEYKLFQRRTTDELFKRIETTAKAINPKLVVICYSEAGVDLIRIESSSSLSTQYEWNYNATDHVKAVLGSYKDRMPSNLLQYFLAITYRHIGTSPNTSRIWVLENMLNGCPLDIYVAGTLEDQQDRVFLPVMNDIFKFHKAHEKLFTNLQAVSNIALIKGSTAEYRGIIKLLSENHLMYDIVEPEMAGSERMPRKLESYEAIIVGDVIDMSDALVSQLDNYVKKGGKLLVTGFSGKNDAAGRPINKIRFESLGVMPDYTIFPRTPSSYLKLVGDDKTSLGKEFNDIGIMMLYTDLIKVKPRDNAKIYMRLLPHTMFGPPEKIYYTEGEITDTPGMISNSFGKGRAVFIPWEIGAQYNFKGHHAHRALFITAIQNLLGVKHVIETDAPPVIEITYQANRNKAFEWIGLINHSGQIGASIREPLPVYHTTIKFKPAREVKQIQLMRSGINLAFKQNNGTVECVVPKFTDFEMILCLYGRA